jgi:guanine deaminase
VDHLGYISYIGPASSPDAQLILHAAADRVQCLPAGSFLLPTFVDLHLHAPQFLYLGTGLHLPLMQWLEKYAFKAEEDIDNNSQLARKVYTRLVNQLIENGTGAALMFGTLKEDSKYAKFSKSRFL